MRATLLLFSIFLFGIFHWTHCYDLGSRRLVTNFADPIPYNVSSRPLLRVTGGSEIEPHTRGWQMAVLITIGADVGLCGGSLITGKTVLTAAWCIHYADGDSIDIVGGAHRLLENEDSQVTIKSTEWLLHDGWDPSTLQNNIGLIYLQDRMPVNEYIRPVGLVREINAPNKWIGKYAGATGWGLVSDEDNQLSEVLREVTLYVISNEECNEYFSVEEGQMCTETVGQHSVCNGDTGGPLVYYGHSMPYQIGITSFVVSLGCQKEYPAAFTRITEYYDWIQLRQR